MTLLWANTWSLGFPLSPLRLVMAKAIQHTSWTMLRASIHSVVSHIFRANRIPSNQWNSIYSAQKTFRCHHLTRSPQNRPRVSCHWSARQGWLSSTKDLLFMWRPHYNRDIFLYMRLVPLSRMMNSLSFQAMEFMKWRIITNPNLSELSPEDQRKA
jgi:hypothetical protein